MNFNLENVEGSTPRKVSPYITFGSGQVLRINSIELKTSQNTGSPRAILHMESQPIKEEGFEGLNGAKGQLGKVALGVYMKTDQQKMEFLTNLKIIAIALGLEDEFKGTGNSFEEIVSKVEKIIAGPNKYARYTILAEEYAKDQDKTGIKLFLPRYNFVESISTLKDDSRLLVFDKSNAAHYKKLPAAVATATPQTDDLPF